MTILGLHHITIVCADAQRTIDFYAGLLGLRLVKLTVNFDDPDSYHLYFGDELGRPATAITFFEWRNAPPGAPGRTALRLGPCSTPSPSPSPPSSPPWAWSSRCPRGAAA